MLQDPGQIVEAFGVGSKLLHHRTFGGSLSRRPGERRALAHSRARPPPKSPGIALSLAPVFGKSGGYRLAAPFVGADQGNGQLAGARGAVILGSGTHS